MTEQEIKTKIDAQRTFFKSNITKDVKFRIDSLRRLKTQIILHETEILDALYHDLHKSDFEGYSTEVGIVINEINVHIRHLRCWARPEYRLTPITLFPSCSKIYKEPYGVVLVIAPWNYPFQLLLNHLVAAISAGNCVTLKSSPNSTATNGIIEKILNNVFAEEYVTIFHGHRDVNQMLLNQRFDYIFFTGSPILGKTVMEAASKNLTPVTLELGGKSPCIIDYDADVDVAAKRVVWGKTINAGQTCVAPDYLMVHELVKEKFVSSFSKYVAEFFGDNPSQSPDYPRIVSQKAMERLVGYLGEGSLVLGGRYDTERRYIEPTIITNLDNDSKLLTEEIFGPIFPLIIFNNIDEVISMINSKEKPLALYYFSSDQKKANKIIRETSSGGVCINDTIIHVANHRIPFGGVGNSGMGMYHGKYGFDTFTHKKSVVISKPTFDMNIKYPPYEGKFNKYKRFL
ncbi:MAG: aldehyde dehydrogenase [Bacteroidales bacterium]|nr:aldehyde dehydrogenase [Bacteroidales bacterium]